MDSICLKRVCGLLACAALGTAALAGCSGGRDAGREPVRVKAVRAGGAQACARLYYSGVLEAEKNVALAFLSAGTVAQVRVREGDRVAKGDLLARLDCESNENALGIAREKERQARDAFDRFEPIYNNGNLAEIKMVEIRTSRNQAELALKLAEKNVRDCELRAPVEGLLSRRAVEPGDTAGPGVPVLGLVSVGKLYASVAVPEKEIGLLEKGASAGIAVAGEGDVRLEGKVADVGVVADPLSRTYTARVQVENPGGRLRPGMLCDVYIGRPGAPSGVPVPATALKIGGDGQQYVFVVEQGSGRVRRAPVKTAGFSESMVLVSSGLKGGELVVSEGAQKLDDGVAVQVEP